ncbi:peptidase inhibitor family I36 protein [Streptomyces sp. 1222.5]|uniref:peptidase inhibitor family I36 protein n=1 Tax=Streptomyces sp. 1222.5 TaxID=1881026 RepID=UPI003D7162FB
MAALRQTRRRRLRAAPAGLHPRQGQLRGKGGSVTNSSSRTARIYQKDNYFGRHVCIGREGGAISDLCSYQLTDTTHSPRNNDIPCGA